MFSRKITESARFLKMPASTQALYFHLGLHADDDGVVEGFSVMQMVNATEDELRILVMKGFVTILNEDLVAFINDWKEHNCIRADRKVDSVYKDLLLQILPHVEIIQPKERAYKRKKQQLAQIGPANDGPWPDNGPPKLSKDKLSKDKGIGRLPDSSGEESSPAPADAVPEDSKPQKKQEPKKTAYGEFQQVKLTEEEYTKLLDRLGTGATQDYIARLDGWLAEGGPKRNKKSHYATILNWWRKDHPEPDKGQSGWEEPKGGKFW